MNFVIDPPNVGATSATITAGQTAIYQLDLQSIDGFTNHRTTDKQKFSKYVTPRIAVVATLEIALILSIVSCSTETPPTPQSGTPANTYTLTLSAATPGGAPPTTQPLTLTVQ
jgi:hypothetical protein